MKLILAMLLLVGVCQAQEKKIKVTITIIDDSAGHKQAEGFISDLFRRFPNARIDIGWTEIPKSQPVFKGGQIDSLNKIPWKWNVFKIDDSTMLRLKAQSQEGK